MNNVPSPETDIVPKQITSFQTLSLLNVHPLLGDSQICDTNSGSCLIFWVQNGRIFDLGRSMEDKKELFFTEEGGIAPV